MTGEHASADRARRGVYEAEFDHSVAEFAETIAAKPLPAIQAIKRSAAIATRTTLEEGIAYDRQQFEPLLSTDDPREGVRAFVEDDYEADVRRPVAALAGRVHRSTSVKAGPGDAPLWRATFIRGRFHSGGPHARSCLRSRS